MDRWSMRPRYLAALASYSECRSPLDLLEAAEVEVVVETMERAVVGPGEATVSEKAAALEKAVGTATGRGAGGLRVR